MSNQINYSQIKPKGFPSEIIPTEFVPNHFFGDISAQDNIRFQINRDKGFWDPATAFIDVEIDFTGMDPGTLQLDGSAQSLINQMQIFINQKSVENIQEYDSIVHFLSDMNYCQENKKIRLQEGVSYNLGKTVIQQKQNTSSNILQPVYDWQTQTNLLYMTNGDYLPMLKQAFKNQTNGEGAGESNGFGQIVTTEGAPQWTIGDQNAAEIMSSGSLHTWGALNNWAQMAGGSSAQWIPVDRYDSNRAYNDLTYSPNLPIANDNIFSIGQLQQSPAFNEQNWETSYSNTYQTRIVKNGNFGVLQNLNVANLRIPLCSGLLGVLMPNESYKYIPMQAMKDLVFEFKLNRFAFFTSGFTEQDKPTNQINSALDLACYRQGVQQRRSWVITKFNINVDLIFFEDPAIEQGITNQLRSEGILFHSVSWMLMQQNIIANTSTAQGNFQINHQFESLKNIVLMYELNDYKQYSYCRKHYRVSKNLTNLYIQVGAKVIPLQGFRNCHGGNAVKYNAGSNTNLKFVEALYKAFNKTFSVDAECQITTANFAPNKRPYDVTQTPLIFGELNIGQPIGFGPNLIKCQTAMGLSLWYENMVRGMAAYAIPLDGTARDQSVIGGLNTMNNTPWNLIVETDAADTGAVYNNYAERECTMQVWGQYDFLVLFKEGQAPEKIGVL